MDDTKYNLDSKPVNEIKFNYGGQAVIEGVMMRGQNIYAVAVRDPKGGIVIHEQPVSKTLYRGRIARTPFVRGLVGLWDALGIGTRALMWSADVAAGEEVEFNGPIVWVSVIISLAVGLGIFAVLPTALATGVQNLLGLENAPFLVNLIEGVIQIAILIAYISLIARMNDVKRLFGYHGAEHKTINAYEAGAELTPEVVAKYPIEHPRCGTAFLLTVAFVGVLLFSILGRPDLPILILSRVIGIPVVAGVAYEVLRFTAKHADNPLIRIMIIPNLALQHLTTRQPDKDMLEVAIAAFKRVLYSEGLLTAEEAAVPQPAQAEAPAAD
ncbi:MAG TPA: DUF1385 domain-containing protein [Aggregatilineales bacterium]|jgi:uncharacterized protein YqhQ|nr:DUF1385 domain-containing protein [Aggregatilineales bacterium]